MALPNRTAFASEGAATSGRPCGRRGLGAALGAHCDDGPRSPRAPRPFGRATSLVILAADIGGTHARFQLARSEAGRVVVLDEARLTVAAHDTVDAAGRIRRADSARRMTVRASPSPDRSRSQRSPANARLRLDQTPWRRDCASPRSCCANTSRRRVRTRGARASACVTLQRRRNSDLRPAERTAFADRRGQGSALRTVARSEGLRVIAGKAGTSVRTGR